MKKAITNPAKKTVVKSEESVQSSGTVPRAKKVCAFCTNKTMPFYTDTVSLRRFLTERGKIVPKLRSGLCSKHQRKVTTEIKRARHLALLPFTPKV